MYTSLVVIKIRRTFPAPPLPSFLLIFNVFLIFLFSFCIVHLFSRTFTPLSRFIAMADRTLDR